MSHFNFSFKIKIKFIYKRLAIPTKLKFNGKQIGIQVFENLVKNIKKLIDKRNKTKSTLEVNVSYILYPSNYKEIYKLAKKLKEIGVDNFRMKQDNSGKNLLSDEQMKEANLLLNKIDKITDSNFKFIKIHKLNNPSEMCRNFKSCTITDLMSAIGSDGNVYPCNYHPRVGGFSYGNAINSKFQEIWESEERMKIRKKLPKICPKVCDPFKNRASRLFEEIKDFLDKEGEEKYLKMIKQITDEIIH